MYIGIQPVRFVLWVFIFFALTIGAGLYWFSSREYQGQAAETINASKETVMTNTLVGYWTLDGNDIVWGDANEIKDVNPGTKHDGNVAGSLAAASAVPGRTGQGLLFNGTTDSISLGNVYNGVKTIAFWVKPNTTTQSLIDLNATATVDMNAGTVRGNNFATPTIYVDGAATSTFPDTGWHYVAITTDTGINASAAYIGQIASSYFGGIIDDIRFYSDALTATQVADLYRASGAKEISNANHREALTNGLVGYWTFDGRDIDWDDASEIKDISGNGNHGNAQGSLATTSVTPGKLGQGLSFNGTSDYVSVPNSTTFTDLSVSAWIYPTFSSSPERYASIISNENIFDILIYCGGIACIYKAGLNAFTENSDSVADVVLNTWHHLVLTFNNAANRYDLYQDGVLQSLTDNTWTGNLATPSSTTEIGYSKNVGTLPYFPGKIDDVRIYNRTLSASEVLTLYNLGK